MNHGTTEEKNHHNEKENDGFVPLLVFRQAHGEEESKAPHPPRGRGRDPAGAGAVPGLQLFPVGRVAARSAGEAVPVALWLGLLPRRARAAAGELYPALPPWAERRVLPCRHGAAAGRVRRDHAHRPLQGGVCQHGWHLEASVDERQRARVRRRGVCIACDHAGAAGEKGAGDGPARCAVRRVFDDGVPLDACRRDRGRALARARAL